MMPDRIRPRRTAAAAFVLAAACLVLLPASARAQHGAPAEPGTEADTAAAEREAPPLYDNLGPLKRPITTTSPLAQAYFDQGLRLAYGFAHGEAARSFREAQHHDPECASCFWGEAWALGPNINGRMRADVNPAAYAALERARELGAGASPVEQALIEALGARYAEGAGDDERPALDSAYARAMDEIEARFPRDLDVLTLAGEAHMVLRPWAYWQADGAPEPGIERVVALLERALDRDVEHPGACHLYIHLVEASPSPARGEACADRLADGIPGVSHIPHMPSHIYMRTGRYGDAVRGNQRAWIADQRAQVGGALAVYPTHNLHMLLFAGSMDGQSAVAIQAARDLARLSAASSFYVPLVLTRFGRWDEILEEAVDEASDFRAGVGHFARGLARLRTGDLLRAAVELQALRGLRARIPEDDAFRGHPQRNLLGMAEGVLAGEILADRGEIEAALEAIGDAVALDDALEYDEPEPWTIPVRHHMGGILLDAGRAAEAEAVFRRALEIHPGTGWSLRGLATALRAQGREAQAVEIEARFEEAWSRADVWIGGPRF